MGPIYEMNPRHANFKGFVVLTISFVHVLDHPNVLSSTENIMIYCIQRGDCGELWAWEVCQGTEIEAIYEQRNDIAQDECQD
jgi:hypothetical protein